MCDANKAPINEFAETVNAKTDAPARDRDTDFKLRINYIQKRTLEIVLESLCTQRDTLLSLPRGPIREQSLGLLRERTVKDILDTLGLTGP